MEHVIDMACAASKGEFVKHGAGDTPGTVVIHRWEKPEQEDANRGVGQRGWAARVLGL